MSRLLAILCSVFGGCLVAVESHALVEQRFTAFSEGSDGTHCQRIPSLITAKDGTLLLACESRRHSWRDKSPTDVVLRRSADGGKTWSATQILLPGGNDAHMDPCLVVDHTTGRVFLFASRWPAKDHSTRANTAWLVTSDDNGATWTTPKDVSQSIVPQTCRVDGFGPGSGLQLSDASSHKGRLIVPIRLLCQDTFGNATLYSDDHGETWLIGETTGQSGEFQIAEGLSGQLVSNYRDGTRRLQSTSDDAGLSWTSPAVHPDLPSITYGCMSSVLGVGKVLLYTGPAGTTADKSHDNRGRLTLRRSLDGGKTWPESIQLNDTAAGYSCLTRMNDGRIAVVFETADTPGFITGTERRNWMRLDVLILSASVTDPSKPLSQR